MSQKSKIFEEIDNDKEPVVGGGSGILDTETQSDITLLGRGPVDLWTVPECQGELEKAME